MTPDEAETLVTRVGAAGDGTEEMVELYRAYLALHTVATHVCTTLASLRSEHKTHPGHMRNPVVVKCGLAMDELRSVGISV